jgi:hypothetical protein
MTAEIENLVLEHLRGIRADLADIKRDVTANSLELSAMGQQLAGLTAAVYGSKSDVEASIKRRPGTLGAAIGASRRALIPAWSSR